SIQIRVLDTFRRPICDWLDVPVWDDASDVFGILRQPERHGQPVARLDLSCIAGSWVQFDESEMRRRIRPLPRAQTHLPLHHPDGLAIQDAIRPTAGDEYRQA